MGRCTSRHLYSYGGLQCATVVIGTVYDPRRDVFYNAVADKELGLERRHLGG